MAELTYSVRPHSFSGTMTYELHDDALCVQDGGATKRVPYREITRVGLIRYGNFGGLQGQCTIKIRKHGKLKLRSHHFVSLGQFESRTAAYVPFVREMCRRIHAANPGAAFVRGNRGLQAVWGIVLLVSVFGWIGWIAAQVENTAPLWRDMSVFAIMAMASLLGAWGVVQNRARPFDPLDPPLG